MTYQIPPHLQKFEWYAPHLKWVGYDMDAEPSRADLRGADLREADLSWADLREADLRGAIGQFATGSFGRHRGVAAGGYISIGCERHTYQHWRENYESIGRTHDYTEAEIAMYGSWIHLATSWLEPLEAAQ